MKMRIAKTAAVVLAAAVGWTGLCAPGSASPARSPVETPAGFNDQAADSVPAAADEEALRGIKEEMSRLGGSEVPAEAQWQRRKSPTVAMLSSMVLPGLGQLYNGRKWKTVIAAGVFTYYMGTAWLERKTSQEYLAARDALEPGSIEWKEQDLLYEFHRDNAKTYLWWSGAAWLIIALDAWVDAHLYDVRAVTPGVARGPGDTKYITLSVGF